METQAWSSQPIQASAPGVSSQPPVPGQSTVSVSPNSWVPRSTLPSQGQVQPQTTFSVPNVPGYPPAPAPTFSYNGTSVANGSTQSPQHSQSSTPAISTGMGQGGACAAPVTVPSSQPQPQPPVPGQSQVAPPSVWGPPGTLINSPRLPPRPTFTVPPGYPSSPATQFSYNGASHPSPGSESPHHSQSSATAISTGVVQVTSSVTPGLSSAQSTATSMYMSHVPIPVQMPASTPFAAPNTYSAFRWQPPPPPPPGLSAPPGPPGIPVSTSSTLTPPGPSAPPGPPGITASATLSLIPPSPSAPPGPPGIAISATSTFTPPGPSAPSGPPGILVSTASTLTQTQGVPPCNGDSTASRAIIATPGNTTPTPTVSNSSPHLQPVAYQMYAAGPPLGPPPQATWLHPPQFAGLHRPPYVPYPGGFPGSFPLPPRPVSLPQASVPTASQPPGATPLGPPGAAPAKAATGQPLSNLGDHLPPGVSPSMSLPAQRLDAPIQMNSSNQVAQLASSKPFLLEKEKQGSEQTNNEDQILKNVEADSWTAHKTESGAVYYYNALTGESTYEKPPGFRGEAEKLTLQPTPVSWEKLTGTDWALVSTNDGKKYYYNTKSQNHLQEAGARSASAVCIRGVLYKRTVRHVRSW